MSKTTPEEAVAIAMKYGTEPRGVYPKAFLLYPTQLAALIDEVRSTPPNAPHGGEPICSVCRDVGSIGEPPALCPFCKIAKLGKQYKDAIKGDEVSDAEVHAAREILGYKSGQVRKMLTNFLQSRAAQKG